MWCSQWIAVYRDAMHAGISLKPLVDWNHYRIFLCISSHHCDFHCSYRVWIFSSNRCRAIKDACNNTINKIKLEKKNPTRLNFNLEFQVMEVVFWPNIIMVKYHMKSSSVSYWKALSERNIPIMIYTKTKATSYVLFLFYFLFIYFYFC